MSIKITDKINEGSTTGFQTTIYDSNSDVIVPNSLDWWLYDSRGFGISSGTASSLSSQSLIVLGSSLTMTVSGETKPELTRVLHTKATYNDSELGNNAIEQESFVFTLVNNPGI